MAITHARTTIRDRIVTLLTGLDTTASNVFKSRVYTIRDDQLPALTIYTSEESVEEVLGNEKELRELLTTIQISVKATTDFDDTLSTIRAEVEVALATDKTLGIGVEDSHFQSLSIDYEDIAEQPIAQAELIWRVIYTVNRLDVTTIVT